MTELLACERVWLGCRNTATSKLFAHASTVFAIAELLDLEAAGAVIFRDLERETGASVSVTGRAVVEPLLAEALQRVRQTLDEGAETIRLMWALNAIIPNATTDAMPYLANSGLAIRQKRRPWGRLQWQPNPTQQMKVLKEARDDVLRGEFRTRASRDFLIAASACNYESQILGRDGLTDSDLTQRLVSMLCDDVAAQAFSSVAALTTHARPTVYSH